MRGEMRGQAFGEHRMVVGQVVLGDSLVSAQVESAAQGIAVRAAHLPGLDRLVGIDEFVTGRCNEDAGLGAHVGPGQPGGCEHREFRRTESGARREQQVAFARIQSTRVDVEEGLDGNVIVDDGKTVVDAQPFDRHDAVATLRQHCAGHDLDACGRISQRQGWLTCGLGAADAKPALAFAPRR